jgi:hypothetical protein
MLKFFFNRNSLMVRLMNAVALLEIVTLGYFSFHPEFRLTLGFNTLFLMTSWLVFNLIHFIPWYPGQKEKLGIRFHFQKNLVPISYLLVFAFALKLAGVSEWVLLPFTLLFLPIYYVSAILLLFHFRDTSSMTPGYFSHNLYLKEEEVSWSR